jgi:hypothetical protein
MSKKYEWVKYKDVHNLRVQCSHCEKPAGFHGASDGSCPKGETKFKPFKDLRKA